jgi:multidrug efflux system membrane fusion protein
MRITSLLLALIAAAGLYYWFGVRGAQTETALAATTSEASSATAEQAEAAVPVLVLPSIAQETTRQLTLRGRTEANRNVQITAETNGQVISEPLRRGATIAKGDVLCRLDPGVRAAQLAEAEASLTEAQAEADAATQLQRKGFTAETTLKSRKAQLQAAQARVDQVKWDIDRLEIRAPFDGALETDTAEIGTFLTSGSYCANIIDLSRIKVSGFVGEQDVDRLSIGQQTSAKLINGMTATGEIAFISRMADAQTRTYAVEVVMDNPDGLIRDGMTAELTIDLPAETAHLIPQTALTLDDDGRLGVRIAENDATRFIAVTILRDEAGGAWVHGLPPQADVIVVGQEFVRDGRAVKATRVSPDDLR